MKEQLIAILWDSLALLIPVLIGLLAEYVRRKIGIERLKAIQEELVTKQDLAMIAVQFIEQAYYKSDGPTKLNEAMLWFIQEAGKRGIKVTDEEVRGLIEASLRAIKDALGEEWATLR
jgi:LL-H family phage holin